MHRWLVAQKDPVRNGEMYRIIADTGGAFVQPALYEAFGLTVVEVSHHPQLSCMLWPNWMCCCMLIAGTEKRKEIFTRKGGVVC